MSDVDDEELLDLVHDAVIVRRHEGQILKWNRAAADRYGYTADEAVGRTVEELLSRSFVGVAVEDMLRQSGFWEGAVRVKGRDGRAFTASCRQRVSGSSHIIEVHGPIARMPADLRLVIDHMPGLVSYIGERSEVSLRKSRIHRVVRHAGTGGHWCSRRRRAGT